MRSLAILLVVLMHSICLTAQTLADSLIMSVAHLADTTQIQQLNLLAVQNFNKDVNTSRVLAQKALEKSIETKYQNGEAESSRIVGSVFSRQGKYPQAMEMFRKAETIFTTLGNNNGLAEVSGNMGLVYIQQGQYPNALEAFNKALKMWSQANRMDKAVLMEENIGMVHFRQEDYQGALKYFTGCYDSYKNQGNEPSASKILVNLGATYNRLKMHAQALDAHLKALAFFERTNSVTGMGITYNNIGNVYVETKNYQKAIEYFDKSLKLKQKQNDKLGTSISLRNIAEAYLFINNLEKAKECVDQSLKIAEEIGAKEQIKDAYDVLARMYEKTRDYERALAFEKKKAQARDSLFSSDKTEQISRMRTIYETEKAEQRAALVRLKAERDLEKKDAAIAVLNKENELKNTQRNFFIGMAVSLLAIVLLIFYLYQSKQKSNKLLSEKNALIERTLEEREGLLKEIHHRVKNNLQIISSLLSLQSKKLTDFEAKDAITESRNRVKSMSLIHEQLYQENTISGVEMKDYIERLISSLTSSYGVDTDMIEIKIDAENILLDVDSAIPLGLIINELISNSMKYAFPHQQAGNILVSLHQTYNELQLIVKDNGIGFDAAKTSNQSFGLSMVNSLMRKLKADMKIMSDAGTTTELIIRDFKMVTFTQ